ncbi:MAG TPA: DNA-directed RNA polymerase subunit alpha [Candidatus Saccharimonadales bacterium]|nr:DNA-directed RNA polymerase subunit alpha [Candidatus Saccharimonadales bacterium]
MVDQVKISHTGNNTEGSIVVEPLPQGFGMTLGNALRRVLLSSLEGSAITQAKIGGVAHEYSTIKGVKEDVVQILLNLKKVRLQIEGDKEVKLSLEEKGPKEVKAGDIKVPAGVKITNPEQPIASLADNKTKLEIDMVAEKGVGYVAVEGRRNLGIGTIPLDANFTPITQVSYKIEATRVGQITNFDKLIFDIHTDGTVSPAESVKQASKILSDYFNVLFEQKKAPKKEESEESSRPKIDKSASIEELELATRITNSLKNAGIETVDDLLNAHKEDLVKLKNMGAKSLSDIEEKLGEKGLAKE